MKGSPVSFGEAGDCQTRGLCPEGQFSINLLSTGFKVSPLTVWVGIGAHAPPKIEKLQVNFIPCTSFDDDLYLFFNV